MRIPVNAVNGEYLHELPIFVLPIPGFFQFLMT